LLTDGTFDAQAFSMVVSGKDVYAAGYESNGMNRVAKYWKNGSPVTLGVDADFSIANSITIAGNDVYVAGGEIVASSFYSARYWKNGQAILLEKPKDLQYSIANAITVVGTDIYIAGEETAHDGVYWKNGIVSVLPGQSSSGGVANSIFISGTQ
jgi:hypothetical protein